MEENEENNTDDEPDEEYEDDEIGWSPFDEDNENDERIEPYRRSSSKVGRNEPCPCGSGKKFKKCHGK